MYLKLQCLTAMFMFTLKMWVNVHYRLLSSLTPSLSRVVNRQGEKGHVTEIAKHKICAWKPLQDIMQNHRPS